MSGTYMESRALPPVRVAGLFGYGTGSQKVYPVAECYAHDGMADEQGVGEPEAPHAWFSSEHDAKAFADWESGRTAKV